MVMLFLKINNFESTEKPVGFVNMPLKVVSIYTRRGEYIGSVDCNLSAKYAVPFIRSIKVLKCQRPLVNSSGPAV